MKGVHYRESPWLMIEAEPKQGPGPGSLYLKGDQLTPNRAEADHFTEADANRRVSELNGPWPNQNAFVYSAVIDCHAVAKGADIVRLRK